MAQKKKVTTKHGSNKTALAVTRKSAPKAAAAKPVAKTQSRRPSAPSKTAKAAGSRRASTDTHAKSAAKARPATVAKSAARGQKPAAPVSKSPARAEKPAAQAKKPVAQGVKAVASVVKPVTVPAAAKAVTPGHEAKMLRGAKAPAPARAAAVAAGAVRADARHAPAPAAHVARPVQSPRTMPATVSKPVGQKVTAAVAVESQPVGPKKPVSSRHGFKTNEFIVYPAHGVGRIVGIEEQEIAGMSLELFVITFDNEKLTLRVPTGKLQSVGMRKLSEEAVVRRAMETLKGRARIKRTMWSRRAQEYVAKINSGDLVSIAEVVRDLYRSEAQPEQSYSERQLYESALDRMAREIAAVERLDERGAVQRITEVLSKSARGRRTEEVEDVVEAESEFKAA
jgi:CarD family transcriptional regulator